MPKIEINIPKPCGENWNQMSPSEKGRFCDSCQKTVYNFTKLSDKAIVEKIQSESSLCGRFSNAQMNRELLLPKKKSAIWTASITGILSFLSSANEKSQAQAKPETVQTIQNEEFIGKAIIETKRNLSITGSVADDSGLMIPTAQVKILGTEIATATDFDGDFNIFAEVNDTLVFSFLGFEDYKMTVKQKEPIKIIMKTDITILDGTVTTGDIYVKRSLLGRIINSIGNIFK
ncbi:hypothetical protein FNO01nite_31300 [Flavobacterium noncentrifugens]|uniref:CarboxypepD_reg-like domain-containing protein n=1 Tax=Flavobacterium noncentrifugens TaxID=1128970 RepID=A0A1G9BHW0_9FLAO|nr:carboxypeptidase-like regulatory domain-containing protein [Flavobacterium noncentrifugens]GEP52458.1 hypothetical protein FNO01nite_31300 [Flavobacterium noncentrifugens]SDK39043.1 CarboxypepD_reg-like domain-containing protein [Flavobacterium noncentrifugens]